MVLHFYCHKCFRTCYWQMLWRRQGYTSILDKVWEKFIYSMMSCPFDPKCLPITSFKTNIFRAEWFVFGVKVNHSVERLMVGVWCQGVKINRWGLLPQMCARVCACRYLISPLGSSLTTSRPFRHTTFPVAASTNTRDGILVTLYLFHSFICRGKKEREDRLDKKKPNGLQITYSYFRISKLEGMLDSI